MVDKGNPLEVPIEIKIPATTKFTEALTVSKAGISYSFGFGKVTTGLSKREFIQF